MNWQDLGAALALVLVIEGIMPFVNPGALRRALRVIAELDESILRFAGLTSMILGIILLTLIR